MTSLDASALVQDPEGLGFLKAVLDAPMGAPPADAFSPRREAAQSWTVSTGLGEGPAFAAHAAGYPETV